LTPFTRTAQSGPGEPVTADSNLYISAILRGGKPRDLLNLARSGQLDLSLSKDILAETLGVLQSKFQRTPEQLQEDEAYLRRITRMVEPSERIDAVKADPADNAIIECAVAAGSEAIVSGDKHLLSLGSFRGIPVMTVAAFLEQMQGRAR
jgi:putative PIN family toxin of toxin-antitoxin system